MKFFSPRTRSSKTQDMTEGNPFKLIFFFSIPVLLGNLFQNFYSMADSIIVGRLLGTNALAAVGNTGPMNFLIIGFICGLTSGFAVITAQAFGAKTFCCNEYYAQCFFWNSFYCFSPSYK